MAAKGSALKGALAAGPRGRVTSLPVKPRPMPLGKPNAAGMAQGAGAGLQRVSPGMYRNPQGQLVNSTGGNLPGQRSQQQRPMPSQQPNMGNVLAGAAQGANQFQPQQPMQPATRPPMPYGQGQEPGMVYAGGSANFDETTGQYRNGFNPMPNPDFSQFGPIQFQRQNQGLQQQYDIGLGGQFNPAMQMNPQQQMPQLQPPMGQYGYGRQMGQQQPYNQQPQQGIVAPPPGTPNNGNIY
jgi:hypothetical protein